MFSVLKITVISRYKGLSQDVKSKDLINWMGFLGNYWQRQHNPGIK